MSNKILFVENNSGSEAPRIGGPAMIGGVIDWPTTPEGFPLTLLMSIPSEFLNLHANLDLPAELYVSVFSFYSKDDYFFEYITYHGDPKELDTLRKGYTQVLIHHGGREICIGENISMRSIVVDQLDVDENEAYQGSKIGPPPGLLQNQPLSLDGYNFALQIYGGDFPKPYRDILYLSDAVGYLYIRPEIAPENIDVPCGLFFVQAT